MNEESKKRYRIFGILPEILLYGFFIFTICVALYSSKVMINERREIRGKIENTPDSIQIHLKQSWNNPSEFSNDDSVTQSKCSIHTCHMNEETKKDSDGLTPYYFAVVSFILTLFMFVSKWNVERAEKILEDSSTKSRDVLDGFNTSMSNLQARYNLLSEQLIQARSKPILSIDNMPRLLKTLIPILGVKHEYDERELRAMLEVWDPARAVFALYEIRSLTKLNKEDRNSFFEAVERHYTGMVLDKQVKESILKVLEDVMK